VNLRQLEVFHAIMTAGSTVGAARLLGVAQPSVSAWLRQTEADLRLPLFNRVRGRLVPTREARMLHLEIQKVFDQVGLVRDLADRLRHQRPDRLSIAAIPPLGALLVPRAVASFMAENPVLGVQLQVRPRREVAELVVAQAVDVGLSFHTPDSDNLRVEELCRGRLICIMPRGHPLARRREVRPADIAGHRWISYTRSQWLLPLIERAFADDGVPVGPAAEVLSVSTACSLVEAGAGISLVDEFSVMDAAARRLVRRPFVPLTPIPVDVLYATFQRPSVVAARFVEHLHRIITTAQRIS